MSSVAPRPNVTDDFPSTAALDAPPRGSEHAGQGGPHELAPGRYLILDGGEHGEPQAIALTAPVTHIGRARAADVHLDDHTVSARHAIIVTRPTMVRIFDEGSTNGMLVNGRRSDEAQLEDGDVVVLGRVVLTYRDQTRPA
jgi:hypothetical protein